MFHGNHYNGIDELKRLPKRLRSKPKYGEERLRQMTQLVVFDPKSV